MSNRKKNYSEKLKNGIPKVISYQHSLLQIENFKFHTEVESVTYDKKDIYDVAGKLDKIDITKQYISAFDI